MMRKFGFILLLFSLHASAQLQTYLPEEASVLSEKDSRPIVVFVHASWCKICGMMQQTTFKNTAVIEKLNRDFYFVPFDAESTADISFSGSVFRYKSKGISSGIHDFAVALGADAYPTLVVLAPDSSVSYRQSSFISAEDLIAILNHIKPD